MKYLFVVFACASLVGCGTRPPFPPECEGALIPINGPSGPAVAGAMHESRTNP